MSEHTPLPLTLIFFKNHAFGIKTTLDLHLFSEHIRRMSVNLTQYKQLKNSHTIIINKNKHFDI